MSINQRILSDIHSFSRWKYDVFLSFRGEDTRRNFTDHLHAALNQKGINIFKDDKELQRGKAISPELFKAIEESKFSIVVFSRNYAYSTWCLDELVKIVECKNTSDEQRVFPIFYDVEPTVVRKQAGNFQGAFVKYEEAFREDIEKVDKWRRALTEVANLSGWELKDRHEVEFIQEITNEISRRLLPTTVKTFDNLVGINSRLKKLMRLVRGTEYDDVHMIGIWGIGGIGKTTIARVVYELICYEFEGSSFLANVREISKRDGLIALQKQLLAETLMEADIRIHNDIDGIRMIKSRLQRRKVLVVVDDVAHMSQLNKLVGSHFWFGLGSRIIITTRDKHLLTSHRVNEVYKVESLSPDEAFRLFCFKAFDDNQPSEEYTALTTRVLNYANGLPLAIDILGAFLFGRPVIEWRCALESLNRDSENEILDILRISFDGLKEIEKKIFLDTACFFKGKDRDYVTKVLDYCDFYPGIGISVLIEKSLITISNENKLWMHDLLEEMGKQIIMRQSPEEPGKRSRLWKEADVRHVLTKNTGTEAVEVMVSSMLHSSANGKAFSNLTNLRLLIISDVQLPEGFEYLSNELRMIEWHGYPLKSLPSNSQLDKIIEITVCYSHIEQMWKGVKPLNKLKFIRLSHSKNLISTPDFSGIPNLEELILEGCTRLCEVHPSLLVHKKIILLNLKDCISLMALPSKMCMESLKTLVLSGCSELRNFPEIVGSMQCLLELFLDGTAIEELPLSIEVLTGLAVLNLKNCTNLVRLPNTINGLTSLKTLNLSGCFKPKNELESPGPVESLEDVNLSGIAVRQPMSCNFPMTNLQAISFQGCKEPSSTLWYSELPISLMQRSSNNMAFMLPYLSGLCSLTKLDLSDCNLRGVISSNICNLSSLEELNLSRNKFVLLPGTINRLCKLKNLKLKDCRRLEFLPELPPSIKNVEADGCASLETLSDAVKLCKLNFSVISGINCLKLLGNINLAFSVLRGFLEAESHQGIRFSIVVPGSKIPEWFIYQNEGSEITIKRPSEPYKSDNVVGYAICCVFYVKYSSRRSCSGPPSDCKHVLQCDMEIGKIESFTTSIHLEEKFGQALSDHLWLFYWSRGESYAQNLLFKSNHVELFFQSFSGFGLRVKRCGYHPVYQQDGNQKSNSVRNLNVFHQDFVAATSTRSLSHYVAAEASRSSCSEGEEPRVKRFRELK